MSPPKLCVLVVAANTNEAHFVARVLEDHGDIVRNARDVPDALSNLAREPVDMALISLSLPRGDGLALVHHLRALYPDVDVVVMAGNTEMEETAHAMALGVLANVMRPLTGDALLVAADRARERRLLIAERARLAAEEASVRHRTATYARCATFVSETDATTVAARVLDACLQEVRCKHGAIYIPLALGSSRLVRAAVTDDQGTLPYELKGDSLARMDPTNIIEADGDRLRVVLLGDSDIEAVAVLVPETGAAEVDRDSREALEVIAALGTASFSAARKVDAIARTGIKDPETSAYTFAYFGDVAGREIDRAARHGRRFALLILSIEGMNELREQLAVDELVELRRAVADALLDAVRDSDVLARVEDDEFYLLLPETGLLGALACRRRIRTRFLKTPELRDFVPARGLEPIVGIAVYPTDGGDLGRLLRVGRRRSERSRRGVWRRLRLGDKPFWDAMDVVLGADADVRLGQGHDLALDPKLKAAHDEACLARHAVLPEDLVARIGETIASDAVRHGVAGTMYVAGDAKLASTVVTAVDTPGSRNLRAWVLGRRGASEGRNVLPVDDPRLDRRILILSLTEIGGYVLVARPLSGKQVLVYHASDLDLVDGLVSSLQSVYHLQPEVA